jgi:hypothetical protein
MPTCMITVGVGNHRQGSLSLGVEPETCIRQVDTVTTANFHTYALTSGSCFQSVV